MAEYEPEEGEEAKTKEQKQLTMAVEAVTQAKLKQSMAKLDPGTHEEPNMLRASFFSVGASSRHWIYTPPYKGCELTSAEMRIVIDRYFGVSCKTCEMHVGKPVRGETARHITRGLEIVGPQCVQERAARRMRSSAAEADMDEFRAGIHNDRGFGNDFRSELVP